MADEVASLLVKITADGSTAISELNKVSATVATLADKNTALLTKVNAIGGAASKVGGALIKTFGTVTVAGLVASAKAAGQLNKELANIGTLSVPTERLKEFKGQIQDVAIATGKSTSDISEGMYQVISAFGDTPDTAKKVEINAKAATAGLATTADSIALTSAVTKAYGDTSAGATQKVADLAFKTVELGQTTFPELAQNMQQVTSLSKELGVSQEELFGAYATLTGVTGNAAEVQTQMKAVYTALLKPSDNMQAAISKLGYSSGFAMIKTLGFAGTLKALKSATNGSEERMLGLFNNVRAMPAVMALTGAQSDVFAQKLEKMENASGAATKAFEVQTEGIAKTGFTLEQAKAKMQVAAQNFGESAAPLIGDVADVVDRVSTSLANMSDEQRKNIINTGVGITKTGIALTLGGKAITLGTKIAGTAKSVAGTLAKMGPVGGIAAAGIATVTAAVVIGKKAYEAWYDSQYRWSKGLSEGNAKVKESLDKYKNLSDIQGQIKSLKLIIENPESSKAQVDEAKAKLEEIKALLEKDYNLVIKSDNSNLEDVVEAVRQTSKNDLQTKINEQRAKLATLMNSDAEYEQKRNEAQKKYDDELAKQTKYSEAKEKISAITTQITDNEITAAEGYKKAQEIYKNVTGFTYENTVTDPALRNADGVLSGIASNYAVATKYMEDYKYQINDLDGSRAELHAVSEELANWETEIMRMAALDQDGERITQSLQDMKFFIKSGELDLEGYAQATALAMNGVDSLETAWSQAANGDGTALNGIVTDYIRAMNEFGATTQEAATGAALIQNGFRTIEEAANAGAIDSVVNNFIAKGQELGLSAEDIVKQAAALKNGFTDIKSAVISGNTDSIANDIARLGDNMGMTIEDINKLAHSIGLIPESKKIELNAEGNYDVVNDISAKLSFFDNSNVSIRVNAEGGVDILDKATLDATTLKDMGIVSVRVNAEGNIELLDEAEKKVGIVDSKTAEITFTADASEAEKTVDELQPDPVKVDADTNPAKEDIAALNQEQVEVPVDANVDLARQKIQNLKQTVDVTVNYLATGAVPQAKGTQNFPGGLAMVNDQNGIYDNRELIVDRGRAFIPEGRNVVLPLSKGAKVYTAAQTKAIMRGMGIPHYASGKNNSDAFTSAKDDWTHYTKTHSVTTSQELQKWLEFQEKYKDNEKDIWDIEEQVFSLQKKLYSERVSESEKWLQHEEKYNGMSISDYLAGIDRMKAYTAEYYAQGIINHKEYTEAIADLDEKYLDKRKEQLSEMYDNSSAYISEHSYFNDWEDIGDDPLAAYNRVMERNKDALASGELTQKEFDEYASKLGSDMLSQRTEQSKNWLEEQRKYFGMSDAEYVEGLERIKAYTQEYYDKGLIDRREYNEAMTDLNHSMWDEAMDAYDDMLQKQQDYISEMREQFRKEEQALQDSWAVADRKTDMSEVQAQLDIYAGAVTDRGQKKYVELEKEMKQLQRDEKLYNLQVRNNATIESLEADYKTLEENKKNILNDLRAADIDISGYVDELSRNISQSSSNIESLLGDLLSAFRGFKVESTSMTDNRKFSYNIHQMTPEQAQDLVNKLVGL